MPIDESLFSGRMELADLMESSFEADGAESLQRIEDQIQERIREQVAARSDGLRRFIIFAERLAADAKAVAKSWEARAAKARAYTFEAMKHANVRRIDTPSGSLSIRGNGGVEPLEIYDAAQIPDELCRATVTMPADLWRAICEHVHDCSGTGEFDGALYAIMPTREPSNSAIREALAKPCSICNADAGMCKYCEACGGSGKNSVAGCRLKPRGDSLVVK